VTKIAVFVSGGGTNLQSLINGCKSGFIPGEINLVISSKKGVFAIERAKRENIPHFVIEYKDYSGEEEYSAALLKKVKEFNTDIICLAGFLVKLGKNIVSEYRNRILNIHPALLPDFGGKGMYGIRVHEAVLASGRKESGCSVHIVDEEYDHGPVILQRRLPVKDNDTPQSLARRVLKEEHKLYPEAVKKFISK